MSEQEEYYNKYMKYKMLYLNLQSKFRDNHFNNLDKISMKYKNKYLELQSNSEYLKLFSRIENDKIILNTEYKNKFQDLPTQIPEDHMSNDPPNKNNEWLLETIIDLRKYNMDGSDISNASNYNIINACIFKKNKINIMISSLHNNIPTFHILEYNDNIIELSNIIELDASFSFSPNLASICISDNFASFILNKTYPNNLSNTYNTTVLFIYMKKDNKWDKIKEIPNEIFNDSIALSENNLIVGYNNYLVNNLPSVAVIYNLVNLYNSYNQLLMNIYILINYVVNNYKSYCLKQHLICVLLFHK